MRTMFFLRTNVFAATIAFLVVTGTAASLEAQGGTPHPDGFQFYWPGSCITAIQRSNAFYWRGRQDSMRYAPETDTMLTVSATLARECITKFKDATDATMSPRDYVPLARAYLAVNDDKTAMSIANRRLSLSDAKTSGPRAWILADIIQGFLNASRPRVDAATVYFKQLDALSGSAAAVGKVRAYRVLAGHYWRIGDVPNMIAASERLIAVGRDLNEHDRNEFGMLLFAGYRYLAEAEAARTGDSTAARAVMVKATADIGKLMGVERNIQNFTSLFGLYGSKATPIVANQWITATPADTIHPTPGKFTLVVFRPHRGNTPAMGRLAAKYKDRLNVIGIQGTIGYFRDLGPLTPELEANELRKYYLEDLNVPWSIALSYIEYSKMPDGRRDPEPSQNERSYRSRMGASVILIDPQGIIKRVWVSWDKSYENRIDEAIQRLSKA